MLEANYKSDITNGFEYTLEGFSDKNWVCCPFSVYGYGNSIPHVKLDWIGKTTFKVVTDFTEKFSIEFIAIGRWK